MGNESLFFCFGSNEYLFWWWECYMTPSWETLKTIQQHLQNMAHWFKTRVKWLISYSCSTQSPSSSRGRPVVYFDLSPFGFCDHPLLSKRHESWYVWDVCLAVSLPKHNQSLGSDIWNLLFFRANTIRDHWAQRLALPTCCSPKLIDVLFA